MTTDPWADWYDTYRRHRDTLAAAEMSLQDGLRRQVCWMRRLIVGWTLMVTGATGFAIWLLFG